MDIIAAGRHLQMVLRPLITYFTDVVLWSSVVRGLEMYLAYLSAF